MDVDISPSVVVNNHITVQTAVNFSGYSLQYVRRLLRSGKLSGLKIGQVWLIDKDDFNAYLEKASLSQDRRFGSK